MIGLLREEKEDGSYCKAAFKLGRRLGGDGGKGVMAAVDMFKGLLRFLWKWCIGYSCSTEWGGVCFIGFGNIRGDG